MEELFSLVETAANDNRNLFPENYKKVLKWASGGNEDIKRAEEINSSADIARYARILITRALPYYAPVTAPSEIVSAAEYLKNNIDRFEADSLVK